MNTENIVTVAAIGGGVTAAAVAIKTAIWFLVGLFSHAAAYTNIIN